jgi:hypothetical protein
MKQYLVVLKTLWMHYDTSLIIIDSSVEIEKFHGLYVHVKELLAISVSALT